MDQLAALLAGEDFDLPRIEELLSLDPVLVAQVLRHCQDPPAIPGEPPTTIWDAILRLDIPAIRQVCRSHVDGSSYLWKETAPHSARILEHTLATAAAARALMRQIDSTREQEAYLAGLIHHLGEFALLADHGSTYLDLVRELPEGADLCVAERERLGIDHRSRARALLQTWGLGTFVESSANGTAVPDEGVPLGRVVALAEHIARASGLSLRRGSREEARLEAEIRAIGLPSHTVERVLPAIYEQLRRAASTLGVSYRNPGDLSEALRRPREGAGPPAEHSLRAVREMLRSSDILQTEPEVARWLCDTLLHQTYFERTFLLLYREGEASYVEQLSPEESHRRIPLVVEESEIDRLGFTAVTRCSLRLQSSRPAKSCLPTMLHSEDLVIVPLYTTGRLPVGLLCCDRRYSGEPPRSADLCLADLLTRHAAQNIENRRLLRRLETYKEDAERDYLTSLYNRRSTIRLLEREILRSRRTTEPLSLIMLDIDNFKTFNDIYGHLSGDAVLREVARLLSENARTVDVVGRYGGEEFLIVLPNTTIENAFVFAERLRAVVEHYGRSKITQYPDNPPTISIGVSWVVPDNDSAEHAIERVDRALYGSKKGGRNRVCLEPAELESTSPTEGKP